METNSASSHPTPDPAVGGERLDTGLAIRVLTVFGGGLVLIAAVAGAAARWGDVSVTVRLIALALVLGAVTAAAEFVEGRLAILGRVLSHLSAALVLPVAVVSTAQLGGSWRVCTLVGGIVGAIAVEIQGRRRRAPLLHGAVAIGGVVAAAGLSALTHVPTATIVGALAVMAALAGWTRRTTVLAGTAVFAPIAGVLTTYQIGSGTLAELGLVDRPMLIGAAVGGLFSSAALAVVWFRRRSSEHLLSSVGAFLSSIVPAFVLFDFHVDGPTKAAALGALGVVALGWSLVDDRFATPIAAIGVLALASAPWFLAASDMSLGASAAAAVLFGFAMLTRRQALAVGSLLAGLVAGAVSGWDLLDSPNWRAAACVVGVALLEETVRRFGTRSSSPRHAAALLLATTYLVFGVGLTDRLAVTVVIGLAMAAIGAAVQHRVALWCGIATTTAAVIVASSPTISELPVWVWALAGGLALLGLGGLLEVRRNRVETPTIL
jgi:hypothetical protein